MPLNRFLTRLIWLCVLPLILLSAYLAFDHVRNIHAQTDSQASNLAKNAAIAIDRLLSSRIRGLTLMATANAGMDPWKNRHFYESAQAYLKSFEAHVILADTNMNMVFNTRLPEGSPLPRLPRPSGNAAVPRALQTGQPAVGDLFYGPIAREPLVAIAVPVNHGKKDAFVLLATLDAALLRARLDEISLPEGWSIAIRDSTGDLIARKATPETIKALENGSANSYRAKTAIAPWTIVLEIPESVHQSPLVNSAFILAVMVIGAALIGVIGGAHASRRLRMAVGALIEKPATGDATTAITEIATVRGMIDEAVAHRVRAESANQDTQKRYIAQLEKVFMGAVQVATNLGELRDPFNAGHQRRAGELAAAIGAQLGFDEHRQEGMRVAGYLHDIGTISVPAEIVSRPARLLPAEFELIKQHTLTGYDVLKKVEFPWPVADVALQHHERLDGSGYPNGLKANEIPLEARIMAVADVVEAMCSHRPYRPALGIDRALEEITSGSGRLYDPDAVKACVRLFRELGYQLPD